MDGAKGWFERRLKEAEVSWCLTRYGGGGHPCHTRGPAVVRPRNSPKNALDSGSPAAPPAPRSPPEGISEAGCRMCRLEKPSLPSETASVRKLL